MNRIPAVFLLLSLYALPTLAEIKGKEVIYSAGDTTLKGYLAVDTAKSGQRPAVLIVHEWWGHNDYARKRAQMLAKLGYTALAVDMYGDGKQASHPKDAKKFSGEVFSNMPAAKARFLAAIDLLKSQPSVDGDKIAAIGYCFGGGVVLAMARMGVDLDGVASFHGSLGTPAPAKKGAVKGKVLVLNGAADPFVKPESIDAFKKEMAAANVDYKLISYPDAKHSFTNPEADSFGQKFKLPLQYNKKADQQSWAELQTFFKDIFK